MPLVVVVPGRDSAAPAGPLPQPRSVQPGMPGPPGPPSEAVATAYASADLLISLVTLDPALGADHLPTWADSAVVAVTAAVSSGIRIHAVGEMIRIAGTPLVSTVLIGADKNDESLGAAYTPDAGRGGEAVQRRDDGQRRDEGQRRDAVERPDDDTEDFEVVPDSGADANGSRAPELWWPRARA